MSGKGSGRRPTDEEKYMSNWDTIFGRNKEQKEEEQNEIYLYLFHSFFFEEFIYAEGTIGATHTCYFPINFFHTQIYKSPHSFICDIGIILAEG